MRPLPEIMNIIKLLKNLQTDVEVAEVLGMTKSALSNHKKKGTYPYKELVKFCLRENIDVSELLSGTEISREKLYKTGVSKKDLAEGIKNQMKEQEVQDVEEAELMEIIQLLKQMPQERSTFLELLRARLKTLQILDRLKKTYP